MVSITANAVEEIKKQAKSRKATISALRLGIRGGGCTGFSYLFEWAEEKPRDTDHVFHEDGVSLYVDPKSYVYLKDTELDFVRNMMGHGFKFNNPNVTGQCGCGEAVQF